MIASLRKAYELLRPADRRRLLGLVPLMVVGSLSDVVTVSVAATFFRLLTYSEEEVQSLMAGVGLHTDMPHMQVMLTLSVAMFVIIIVTNLLTIYTIHQVNRFGHGQSAKLSERALGAYLGRQYAWFLDKSSSELKQRLTVETQRVVNTVIVQTTQIATRSLGALLIVAWLLYDDPLLTTVLVFSLGGTYALFYFFLRRRMFRLGRDRTRADEKRHRIADESLVGVKELKLYGMEGQAVVRYREPATAFSAALASTHTTLASTKPVFEMLGVGGLVLVTILFQVTGRPLDTVLATLGAYGIAGYRLLPTIQRIAATAMKIRVEQHALANIHRDIMNAPPEPQLEGLPPLPFTSAITLSDASFRYPSADKDVLEQLSLQLPKGSWTAFVGSTGSGKTTLVDLLMGLLRPSQGTLTIDDRVLASEEDFVLWQQHIGYVPQAMFMGDTTIKANIAFGTDTIDMDEVVKAAHLASIGPFIENEMADGYDTTIGERGMRLSGGQRQRIGIARALYRKPALLVLDEATSALDNRTEAAVIQGLRENYADTTVIMIAHRLSTTRHCDRIFVLERGKILDAGSYDELLERSVVFQKMVAASEEEEPR